MYVINSGDNHFFKKKTAIGLGNFDGLHIGHMKLINTLIKQSELYGMDSMVYTFGQHPRNVLGNGSKLPLITSKWKKEQLLSNTRLEYLYFECFDREYSKLQPEDFVRNILVNKLNVGLIVVGFDYKFGSNGNGDVALLNELSKEYNFKVISIPPVRIGNDIVSSTDIRDCILEGDMENVFKRLGRNYSLKSRVVEGKMLGRKFGFPTANMIPDKSVSVPDTGVYLTKTLLNGIEYNSITNIGIFLTIRNNGALIETYIFDFNKDIYGSEIEVFFITKIRDEENFENEAELIYQIKKDVDNARRYFASANY